MKELTMEQLTVVNGGSDDIAGCKAAYWGMNGGKAGGGFIGGTGYAAGSAAAWAALGCEKIDNIYEKMKNYNPASDTSTPEIFKPKPNWNQPMTMWHSGF
ncbi:hypothetical protein ET965_16885 [Salmonella enterica subsp. enterica serovar Infantis]|uniref:hypothetical protein n=1 Tax=Salmonella enterica TaxID=28901 RepID=UPI00143B6904|nr:hypothetical protein [Salmonella enterica]NKH66310.1 hypothetical protein [Salmonella enterica subsp. enterica serovar Infantis]